jgi:putative ABC transport system substrate-binding protein
LTALPVEVNGAGDLERVFSGIASDPGTGVAAAADVMFYVERKRIAELALARRLPAVFHNEEFARSGGLMTYGASVTAVYRRSGAYVDKILKGAKPSDLPVELPTLYRFVINLKTANALGLTLPPTLLTRADEVIEMIAVGRT